jgi:hypothetical protein
MPTNQEVLNHVFRTERERLIVMQLMERYDLSLPALLRMGVSYYQNAKEPVDIGPKLSPDHIYDGMESKIRRIDFGDYGNVTLTKVDNHGNPSIAIGFAECGLNNRIQIFFTHDASLCEGGYDEATRLRDIRFDIITKEEIEPLALSILRNPKQFITEQYGD